MVKEEHNLTISATKGVGMLLIVLFHAQGPDWIMPIAEICSITVFFFISGIFFKDSYLEDFKRFCESKVKRLYLPFVVCMLVTVFFHNVLANWHLYDDYYSKDIILDKVLSVITLQERDNLWGCFWFVKELIYASFFAYAALWITKKLLGDAFHLAVVLLLALVTLIFAVHYEHTIFKLETINRQTFHATALIMTGYAFRELNILRMFNNWCMVIILTCSTLVISQTWINSFNAVGWDIFRLFGASMIGTLAIYSLCGKITGRLLRILDVIGRYTMPILIFQFWAFRVVDLLKIKIFDLDINRLANFPIISDNNDYFWALYTLAGICIPILAAKCVEFAKYKIPQRLETVK